MPGRALFEATAENAIAWLAENRRWFEPDNVTLPGRRDKPVVELALLVRTLRDAGSEYAGLAALAALVREVGARPARRHAPRPTRSRLLAGAFLFAAAYRASDEDTTEHRRLQRLVDVRLLDTLEQPVHRVMEDRLALEWAGLRHSLPSWQVLARRSILGSKANPAFMDEIAAYQLTHVVMYLTAFGSRPPRPRVETDERSRQLMSTLLVRFVGQRHWDLVGELLLSWALLELGPSAVCDGAWSALLQEVGPDGSVTQPRSEGDPEPGPEPDASFQDRYHPTLVIALAADAWRRGCASLPPGSSGAAQTVERSVLREMADVEAAWLASMLEAPGDADPRVVCDVLVGLWICGTMSEWACERLPAALAHAADRVRSIHDWTGVPAGLVLVVYGLLARSNTVPHGLTAFVNVAAEVLHSSPAEDLSLGEKRVLMHRIGRAAAPPRAPLRGVTEVAEATAMDPTADNVKRLVLASESSAASGFQPINLPASEGWITELLLALAAERAHNYDLVSASRLTRAAVHLNALAAGRTDLVDVLIAHQRAAGGFGLFGDATLGSHARGDKPVESDLALRLSVEVLWTVAEASTPWRLMSAIGPMTR